MSDPTSSRLLDPQIFESLKAKLDEETQVREDLTQIVRKLEAAVSYAQGLLSRIHATPRANCKGFLTREITREIGWS